MTNATGLSRRGVLTWGGAIGVALFVPVAATSAAVAAPRGGHPQTPRRARLMTPARQDDREVPRSLGVEFDDPLPAGTEVEFTYDPDLYELLPRALVRSGAAIVPVDSHTSEPGRTVVSLTAATAAATMVVVGALRPARYPLDICRVAAPTAVGGEVSPTDLDARTGDDAAATPWGAECGVLWDAVDWGGRYRYYVPVSASFTAIGPGQVPAGSELRVRADPRILTGLSVARAVDAAGRAVRGTVHTQVRHGVTMLTWRGGDVVPAGGRVVLELQPSITVPRGELAGAAFPGVDFVAPIAASGSQRESRLTSLTHDVICDAAAADALRPA